MFTRYLTTLYLMICTFSFTKSEETLETYCNINGKKPLQHVSDKFLSLSIDPAVLLSGLNLSEASLLLAKHLSPAYIRIAGPSTRFVKYVEGKSDYALLEDGKSVAVTPSMWFGINEWLKLADLTPVFGLNDVETIGGAWSPKSALPLLEISDRLNVSCYWMLGFDPSTKNESQYKQDLSVFQDVLTAFPERKDSWKIVGSDISGIPMNNMGRTFQDLDSIVTSVMWEPNVAAESFPENKSISKLMSFQGNKTRLKIWTVAPKSTKPITFSSALLWAEQVGNAAKLGYDVVFREPRLHEIFSDTSVYWFSLLHKKLMGNNVLEATTSTHHAGSSVFAHCTRNHEELEYNKRGTLTFMVVNRNLQSYRVKVKLEQVPMTKFAEVQSYILTSLDENCTDIFLNNEQLTPKLLSQKDALKPEKHVTKCKPYISLKVPPKAIGFFVLPKIVLSACTSEEIVPEFYPRETNENLPQSEETVLTIQPRGSFNKNPTLKELQEKIRNEMESDDKFSKRNIRLKLDALKQRIQSESTESQANLKQEKHHLQKTKLQEKFQKQMQLAQMRDDLKRILSEKKKESDSYRQDAEVKSRINNLDLTSEEARRILKDRARAKAIKKNVALNDKELDFIVDAVKRALMDPIFKHSDFPDETYTRRNREINTQLLEKPLLSPRNDQFSKTLKTKLAKSLRGRRDINTKLLNIKSKLDENRQRLEERRSDVVGSAHTLKRNIQEKMKKLKQKNHRFRRDINMDLLKLKTEGKKKISETDPMKMRNKNFFKDREQKEAFIRKPGKTSDEILDKLEEESEEETVVPKKEIFDELADTDESDRPSVENFNSNSKPKKIGLFDRKTRITPFANVRPTNEVSKLKRKKNKDPKDIDDPLTFLTTSDEFSDVEVDLPCIHEYFGSGSDKADETNRKEHKKSKQNYRKTKTVGSDEGLASDSTELLRKKRSRDDEKSIKELGEMDYYYANKLGDVSMSNAKDDDSKEGLDYKETCDGKKHVLRNKDKNILKDEFQLKDILTSPVTTETFIGFTLVDTELNKKRNTLRKRDIGDKNEDEQKTDEEEDKSFRKTQLRQRLKDLQEAAVKNKVKYGNVAKSKLKQRQDEGTENAKEKDSDTRDERTDEEKMKQVLEKLHSLKEKLTQKKKDIDKLLTSESKLQKQDGKLGKKLKPKTTTEETPVRLSTSTINNDSVDHQTPLPVGKVKRSLLDQGCDLFGRYNPLTPTLKEWKPADILSLKRNANFLATPKLNPLNDMAMFRNVIAPNKYLNLGRRRRSIQNTLSDLDKIDSYLNDIEKDAHESTELRNPKYEQYKLRILKEDVNKEKQNITSEIKSEMEEATHSFSETTDTTVTVKPGNDIRDVIEADGGIVSESDRMSNDIRKIHMKEEESVIENFISDVSGFFTVIGGALRKIYIKHIA